MKKYLPFILVLALLVPVAYSTSTLDLITSQLNNAGTVKIDRNITLFNITITLMDGWHLNETHIHVAKRLNDIPKKGNGDPNIDEFTYNQTHGYSTNCTILIDEDVEPPLVVAIHAAICRIIDYAPDFSQYVNISGSSLKVKNPGNGCYFNSTFESDQFTGFFSGWCIDIDNVIYNNIWYDVNASLSTEPIPDGLLEYPENLDLVNYILNQGYIGQTSPSGGTYTMGDIQRAIWALMEDTQSTAGIGSWSQQRVDEILDDAYGNGEGYIPGEGEKVALILYTDGLQITLIMVPVPMIPVYECETAYIKYFECDDCMTVGGNLTSDTENYIKRILESIILLITIYLANTLFRVFIVKSI